MPTSPEVGVTKDPLNVAPLLGMEDGNRYKLQNLGNVAIRRRAAAEPPSRDEGGAIIGPKQFESVNYEDDEGLYVWTDGTASTSIVIADLEES